MERNGIEKSQNEIIDKKNNNPNGLNFNKDKTVILITGSSGFIGSILLNELIENKEQKDVNYFIRGLSRHKNQFDIEELRNSQVSVEIIEGDLSNYDDCIKALSGVDISLLSCSFNGRIIQKLEKILRKRKNYC